MIGRQERIKLLLNQSDAAAAGRMADSLRLFCPRTRPKNRRDPGAVARVQDLVDQIQQTTTRLLALRSDAGREMADLQHAREERATALAEVTRQVSSGSEELAGSSARAGRGSLGCRARPGASGFSRRHSGQLRGDARAVAVAGAGQDDGKYQESRGTAPPACDGTACHRDRAGRQSAGALLRTRGLRRLARKDSACCSSSVTRVTT